MFVAKTMHAATIKRVTVGETCPSGVGRITNVPNLTAATVFARISSENRVRTSGRAAHGTGPGFGATTSSTSTTAASTSGTIGIGRWGRSVVGDPHMMEVNAHGRLA